MGACSVKAVGYWRVSGLSQTDQDGPTRQMEAIRLYAESKGLEIVRTYSDDLTGKTELENRPGLMQLRSDLVANGIKTVVIEKVDRLARDLMVSESIIADFQRNGLEIVSTCEPDLCSSDPTRILVRQILSAFSQYERTIIINKLQSARQRLRARGELISGPAPYGFRTVRKDKRIVLENHPTEFEILVQIRTWAGEGLLTCAAIAKKLNARGIKTRQGREWFPTQIHRIIGR